jgi:hypothetical protein
MTDRIPNRSPEEPPDIFGTLYRYLKGKVPEEQLQKGSPLWKGAMAGCVLLCLLYFYGILHAFSYYSVRAGFYSLIMPPVSFYYVYRGVNGYVSLRGVDWEVQTQKDLAEISDLYLQATSSFTRGGLRDLKVRVKKISNRIVYYNNERTEYLMLFTEEYVNYLLLISLRAHELFIDAAENNKTYRFVPGQQLMLMQQSLNARYGEKALQGAVKFLARLNDSYDIAQKTEGARKKKTGLAMMMEKNSGIYGDRLRGKIVKSYIRASEKNIHYYEWIFSDVFEGLFRQPAPDFSHHVTGKSE